MGDQAIAIVGILLGLVRSPQEIDWATPTSWLFAGGMLTVLLVNASAAYGLGRRTTSRPAAAST